MRKTYEHKTGITHYFEKPSRVEGNYTLQVVFPVWVVKDTSKMLAMIANDFELDPLLKSYLKRYKLKIIAFKKHETYTSVFIHFEDKHQVTESRKQATA